MVKLQAVLGTQAPRKSTVGEELGLSKQPKITPSSFSSPLAFQLSIISTVPGLADTLLSRSLRHEVSTIADIHLFL